MKKKVILRYDHGQNDNANRRIRRSLPTNLDEGKKEKPSLQYDTGQSDYENRRTRRLLPTHSHEGKKEKHILQYDDKKMIMRIEE